MILGIDLATVNCGVCFFKSPQEYSFAMLGMKELDDNSILEFANVLGKLVSEQVCYVDFTFNECFLPNRQKHVAVKYFLAGVLKSKAKECNFIKPILVREYFNYPAKEKKYKLHKDFFNPDWFTDHNEHERDAYLLALMGYQLQEHNT
jgi:hypothetical protein